jgi:DNA-directed RNA polymerase specialized sigma24 family protein
MSYRMDFIQECHIELMARANRPFPSDWSIDRFRHHIARICFYTIIETLPQIHPIMIPFTSLRRMINGDSEQLDLLEHHLSVHSDGALDVPVPELYPMQTSREKKEQVALLLDNLPDEERQAVCLHFGLGEDGGIHSYDDIDATFDLKPGVAHRRVYRGLKRMSGKMRKKGRVLKTHCVRGHPLIPENISKVNRSCKMCENIRKKEAYWRKKQSVG